MNERVINEFTIRVSKAKNYLQDLNNQCEQLKHEADKLKKDLEIADTEKHEAERINAKLKQKYLSSKATTEEGNFIKVELGLEKKRQEDEELTKLRKLKKNL